MTDKKKKTTQRLGSPPADWLTSSDVVLRGGAAETQRLPRIGGPPREFGDGAKPRAAGPLTALVVSEDRDAAARVAISLAGAHVSIRLALSLEDVDPLLDGATAVFAVVPSADAPIALRLRKWGDGRMVLALTSDRATAERLRGHCDAALEPPWNLAQTLASVSR